MPLGKMQYPQEHMTKMVYAKFGGQSECIMGDSKIENFLHHILEMKPNYRSVYHAHELSLEQPKGGRGRLIEG